METKMSKAKSLSIEEKKVRRFLIEKIRNTNSNRYWTFYQELSDECSLNLVMSIIPDRNHLTDILFKIFDFEHKAGRPLLTSIVYGKRTYKQGKGFFKGLQDRKIDNAHNKEIEELSAKENRRKYEKAAVNFWKDDKNFKRHA